MYNTVKGSPNDSVVGGSAILNAIKNRIYFINVAPGITENAYNYITVTEMVHISDQNAGQNLCIYLFSLKN